MGVGKKSAAVNRIEALIKRIRAGEHSDALSQECKDTLKAYLPPQSDIMSKLSKVNIERHYIGGYRSTGGASTGKTDTSEDFIRYLESAKSYIKAHGVYSPPLLNLTKDQFKWIIGIILASFTIGVVAHNIWPQILSPLQRLWEFVFSLLS